MIESLASKHKAPDLTHWGENVIKTKDKNNRENSWWEAVGRRGAEDSGKPLKLSHSERNAGWNLTRVFHQVTRHTAAGTRTGSTFLRVRLARVNPDRFCESPYSGAHVCDVTRMNKVSCLQHRVWVTPPCGIGEMKDCVSFPGLLTMPQWHGRGQIFTYWYGTISDPYKVKEVTEQRNCQFWKRANLDGLQ